MPQADPGCLLFVYHVSFQNHGRDLPIFSDAFCISRSTCNVQRLIQNTSVEESDESVVSLDSVLVYPKMRKENAERLKTVLRRVREHKLFLRLPECGW